jgi:hypothetical protein
MPAKKFRHKHKTHRTKPSFIALLLCSQLRRLVIMLSFFLFFLLKIKLLMR